MTQEEIKTFVFAGNAVFTLVSKKTGQRFTFRVRKSDTEAKNGPERFWVDLLTGPNNASDFTYIAWLRSGIVHQKRSNEKNPFSYKAIAWFLTQIWYDVPCLDKVEFHHEGRCGKCGRPLTDPESIQVGLGPICRSV
jgi:hypothetical protein